MENNIYDLHISEIELRLEASAANAAATARVELSSSIGLLTVPENFNGNATFTSEVVNMPIGYTVKTGTHIVTTPTAPISNISSNSEFTTSSHTIILAAAGSTFIVSTTVTLEKVGESDIIITDTLTITSILPIVYGVKPYSATPTLTSLNEQSSLALSFDIISSSIGRLLIGLPTGDSDMIALQDNNGNIWPASDFTMSVVGGHELWQLNYDTQFTGANIKTFTIKTA